MTAPHKLTAAMRQHKPKLRSTKRMRQSSPPNATDNATLRASPDIGFDCGAKRIRRLKNLHAPEQPPQRALHTLGRREQPSEPHLPDSRPHKRFCAPSPAGNHKYSGRPASEPQRAPLALQVGAGAPQTPCTPHMFPDRPCPDSGRPPLTYKVRYPARTAPSTHAKRTPASDCDTYYRYSSNNPSGRENSTSRRSMSSATIISSTAGT